VQPAKYLPPTQTAANAASYRLAEPIETSWLSDFNHHR
jgi:hypothetical protein